MLPIAGAGDIEAIVWGLILGGGGGAKIKSVQTGEVLLANGGDTNLNITIAAVDLSKSFAILQIRGSAVDTVRDGRVRATLTNTTTLNLRREGNDASLRIRWHVVEFQGEAAVQQIVTPSHTGEATISPVDLNKAFVVVSNSSTSTSPADMHRGVIQAWLKDSTTVAWGGDGYTTATIFVVEVG